MAEENPEAQPPEEDELTLEDIFVHPRRILPEFPAVTVTSDVALKICLGRNVNLPEYSKAPRVRVFVGQRNLVAICDRIAGTLFHPKTVLVDPKNLP
jgi:tRNA pseudouridine55 synthase